MPNNHTQEYLVSLGLNPTNVLQEGWTKEHYFEYTVDMAGKRIVQREWPEGFNRGALLAAMKKDGLI